MSTTTDDGGEALAVDPDEVEPKGTAAITAAFLGFTLLTFVWLICFLIDNASTSVDLPFC